MDRWRADFDNWAIVDTVCFKLFDQVPHAFAKVERLGRAQRRVRPPRRLRAAGLPGAARPATPTSSAASPLIEAAATDERNFVKKGVNWALRAIGGKKSPPLRAAARELAARLAASPDKTARWIGKDARRAFAKADGA